MKIKSYCLGHGGEAAPAVSPEQAALYKSLGATSVESYVTWQSAEGKGRDMWDWEAWDRVAETLAAAGLKWVPFLIAGPAYATPAWYRDTEGLPCRCAEHGIDSRIESLWSPNIMGYAERFMKAFAERYDKNGLIESVLLGIQGDYGEAIYSVSGGGWTYEIPGEYHNHLGFWCGEEPARKDFCRYALQKYKSAEAVNGAWKTSFADGDAITYPFDGEESKRAMLQRLGEDPYLRRRWLDFIEWYKNSMTDYAGRWLEAARRIFPERDVFLCTGGISLPEMGSDFSAQCRAAAKHGCGVRITNEGSDYASNFAVTRQVAAAGRYYGAYFGFEPASRENETGVAARIYNAAASGADQLHDYTYNLASESMQKAQKQSIGFLRRHVPVVPAAAFYPAASLALSPSDWYKKAARLRGFCDFDILDETLIADGALGSYKILIAFDEPWIEEETARSITEWTEKGGRLLWIGNGFPRTVEGKRTEFKKQESVEGFGALAKPLEKALSGAGECWHGVSENGVYISRIGPDRFLIFNPTSTDKAVFLYKNWLMQTVCARAGAITDHTM
ncbi:MAG: family 14 glycosylhydrolase [Abditibacteriota bacterium]|nr:family 14 glycosylhydrolase [Abditibacteriota bacterium]